MGVLPKREINPGIALLERGEGRRYEALLRISEALSACQEPEDLTRILSEQLREYLDFFQFYIIVYKENSTEVEWAVVGPEKGLISAYADVPVQERPSWRAYATQEPFHIADWDADGRVPERLKQGIAAQGLQIGPLVFVPLTTPHRRLGALGMSGNPGTAYSSEDIGFLRLIGRVVAFAIDDNFNLRQAEAAQRELQRQNERLQRSEKELHEVIETIPVMAWSAAADGTAEFFNRRWLDYAGLSADQVQGWGWISAVHPEDFNRLTDYWRGVLASGQSGEIEARLRRSDGVYRWFLFRATPSLDNGRVVKWYGTNTDIEERKAAEQAQYRENQALRDEVDRASMFEEIVGNSKALKIVLSRIAKVASTDSTVFITGETGTGKELIARAVHKRSPRAGRAFVGVNCAAVAPTLISSELFGHEKGAFTGATERRLGRFELADGGTIFLDEVGELLPDTQVALLRVLQEREFERVGGGEPIHVDVRVIAATNRDLKAAIASGAFRQDLFYRLNVFPIEVPHLRERKDDIPMLVEYFVQRYASRAGKSIPSIDKKTLDLLQSYEWPGNIRELQNVIERSLILSAGEVFSVDELWLSKETSARAPRVEARVTVKGEGEPWNERVIIEAALAKSRGRVSGPSGAAAKLGIPPSTLDHRIKALKINKIRFRLR
jgi:PAS domain S-box-containing protein